jgi:hypothetical protein
MSKFRDTPSLQVLAPPADDLSLETREAKLAALSRDAHAEAMFRLKYQILQRVLAAIDTLEAAPKDWRSRLQAVEDASRLFVDDEDLMEDDEED